MDDRERDVLGSGDPDGGWRVPQWLRRALLALAVVAVVVLGGRELLAAGLDGRDRSAQRASPTVPPPGHPLPYDSADGGPSLVGTLDGRFVRVLPDGTVQRGPRVAEFALEWSKPGDGGLVPPQWPWVNGRAFVHDDGRLLYMAAGKLQVLGPDLSGPPRTVTAALRVLPCEARLAEACVVTRRGTVAGVRLSDGTIVEPEIVPRETYAAGGWLPRAVLRDAVVLTRPTREGDGPGYVDVAVVAEWDPGLQVVAHGVQLLGASRSQLVVWDIRSGTGALTSYVLNDTVQEVVPNTVAPPRGWTFLPRSVGFADMPRAAVGIVSRVGATGHPSTTTHALAVIEPYGSDGPAPLVRHSLGVDLSARIISSPSSDAAVFGVESDAARRFAMLYGASGPASMLPASAPPGFYLGGVQHCRRPGGACVG